MVKFSTDRDSTAAETPGKTPGKILELLAQDPYLSIPQIAKQINRSDSATQRAIRKLREQGLVQREGSAKSGFWKVLGNDAKKRRDA